MIRTQNVTRVVRAAALARTARWKARHRGRLDGERGIPRLPDTNPETPVYRAHPLPVPEEAITAYTLELQATARRAAEQMRSRLMEDEQELITRIQAEAVRVVTQYDVRKRPAPAALARFGGWVGEWRTKAEICRRHALSVTEQTNQQILCYWGAVRDHHRDLREPHPAHLTRWAPGRLELDPSWHKPDSWLSTTFGPEGEPTAQGYRAQSATDRALEILHGQIPRDDGPPAPINSPRRPAR